MTTVGHEENTLTLNQLRLALGRISALRREGNMVEALDLVYTTRGGLLGPLMDTLDQIDSESAARLLETRDRINAAADLLRLEGDIFEVRDELGRARACRRRALEYYLEAVILGPAPADATCEALAALRQTADEWRLRSRYQKALAELAPSSRDTP